MNCPGSLLPELETARAVVQEAAAGRTVRTTMQVPVAVGRTAEEAAGALEVARASLGWTGDLESIGLVGTPYEAVAAVERYLERGADGFIALLPSGRARPAYIEAYGELAARFA